jgi:hypothetical protein
MSYAEIIGGNINFLLGQRTMQDSDWDDFEVQNQGLFGLNVDLQLPALPGIEFGFLTSREEGDTAASSADVSLAEVFVGVNKTWNLPGVHPFIGGGLTVRTISTDLDIAFLSFDDEDTDVAAYIHGGAFWRIGEHFNIGVDLRAIVGGEMDLFNSDVNANSFVGALILGYGF